MDDVSPFLTISDKNLFASFCKVSSGSEKDSYIKLSHDDPTAFFFKALGGVDIVSLRETTSFPGDKPTTKPPEVSSCQNVIISKLKCDLIKQTSLKEWLTGAPLVGFSFLEFDKFIYSLSTPFEACYLLINSIQQSKQWPVNSLLFYVGYGQSEVIILHKTNDFNNIFSFVNFIRNIKIGNLFKATTGKYSEYPVLASTITVPLISYCEVIAADNYKKISGKVDVDIRIKCPPGQETEIRNDSFFQGECCASTLGNTDISVHFEEKVDSSDLVVKLLEFREKWKELSPDLVDTNTSISFTLGLGGSPASNYLINYDQIPDYPRLNKIAPQFDQLRPFHANKIREIVNKVKSYMRIRNFYPVLMGMMYSPLRLLGEVENFMEAFDDGQDPTYPFDGSLNLLIDNLEKGLAQRTETNIVTSQSSFVTPYSFGDGVIAQMLAIESFVVFIYDCIFKEITKKPDEIWRGYIFFDNSGFAHYIGDVFSLPYETASSVINDDYNWLTLTHEISHSIFTILELEEVYNKEIREVYSRNCGDHSDNIDQSLFRKICDEVYEIFANWFDYYHFYNKQHDLYQECIWQSWDVIPFVNREKIEYISRSFSIFLLQDLDKFRNEVCYGNDVQYVTEQWESFLGFLQNKLPNIYKKYKPSSVGMKVKRDALNNLLPISNILVNSRFDSFRTVVNKKYNRLDNDILRLFKGEVIENHIDNPYLLVKSCLMNKKDNNKEELSKLSSAIIFSLKNNCKFLEYSFD